MTITTVDGLVAALTSDSADRIYLEKATITGTVAGRLHSLWRAVGQPAQGAIPSAAALCTSALTGAIAFTNSVAPVYNYLPYLTCMNSLGVACLEVWDRLAHYGGLSGTATAAQTVSGMDLSTLAVPADRRGASNYSDVQWYLEWYTATGSTAITLTINVTYDDGSTGNLNALSIPASVAAGAMYRLVDLIPTAGRYIRGVNSVTPSASTGTAGNYGITAVRYRCILPMGMANQMTVQNWLDTGLPDIPNSACLMLVVLPTLTTGTGAIHGTGKIVHG